MIQVPSEEQTSKLMINVSDDLLIKDFTENDYDDKNYMRDLNSMLKQPLESALDMQREQ